MLSVQFSKGSAFNRELIKSVDDWWTYGITEDQRLIIKTSIFAAVMRARMEPAFTAAVEAGPLGASREYLVHISPEHLVWDELAASVEGDLRHLSAVED